MLNYIKHYLELLDKFIDEYSDMFSLTMIVVGGIIATTAVGTLPHGATVDGYSAIYLKHPVYFRLGLVAIVFGFVDQLATNLTSAHKLAGRATTSLIGAVFISLIIVALFD